MFCFSIFLLNFEKLPKGLDDIGRRSYGFFVHEFGQYIFLRQYIYKYFKRKIIDYILLNILSIINCLKTLFSASDILEKVCSVLHAGHRVWDET